MRVDQYISKKFNVSRTKAQELIKSGAVQKQLNSSIEIIQSASEKYNELATYQIIDNTVLKYVARSGLKLEGALNHTKINVKDISALDIGLSTGGFSECLLNYGAKKIIGIDVGHDQLHESLKQRIEFYDGVNAKKLSDYEIMKPHLGTFDLVVIDVSFISLEFILPQAYKFLKGGGVLLSLVKPQFELGSQALNKKGIVKDPSLYKDLEEKLTQSVLKFNFNLIDYFESSIEGGDGNREFFIYAKK